MRRWLALLAAVLVAGCATSHTDTTKSGAAEGFPVTVDNCGFTTVYDGPPRRAVAVNQHAVETMLALGLQDVMVGTAFLDDAILPEYRDAYEAVPVLAEEYPSYEVLLSVEPDFVYGGWPSAFDDGEGRGRQRLSDAGIATHLNAEGCATEPVTIDTVDAEIRDIGRIFGVGERAEQLVAGQRAAVQGVRDRLDEVTPLAVAVYDSGETSVFTSGGLGIGDAIIEAAGGENLFADVPKVWADVSFEQFAEREPDVVLIYDYGDQSVADKKRFLLEHPVLRQVPAVQEQRFAVLPLSSITAGVRVGQAVESLARQLHPDRF
ncbi:iron chelate uptake ABC transporter, solute-binding protein [Mycolicibacterium phlei]|jgi:iron complex transport system substrate-binding protein|uniref:Fe/B12 periplasmic-binding domain-containing protein n=1 Tax=Mycolicibacterium phlei DSM 43239 = CCUG 21000 TaxID=1226750 RepID=A0A5N5VEA7_MYCPH|nr:ABC transporter substrate-binding protein [Mycolicibacterium phlei]VEG07444.1 iron chelate uptake ABC transporter, solute-binding protein [Mycobacteroides chelonae]AMO59312.1 Vitamin B12-binding protein [Mycolicibacterium phlei]EID13724.1 lipoprotein [Mycolicibacterium phlei RIVM601174]KAB7758960.1 hypothetical protein MPHL21000_03905 [Mycolicibacterium phlei DSM 43239 = CCUG 21000]KXW59828.1 hypothetical protein MPHL43072_12130 [Mycolicibacterium phlei DSM 43072]